MVRISNLLSGAGRLVGPRLQRTYLAPVLFPRSWLRRVLVLVAVVVAIAAPFFASEYLLAIAIAVGIGLLGAVPTNLLIGVAGQASVGNAAFMAIGAFASAETTLYWNWPLIASILAGGAAAGIVGVVVGIPAMRVRGLYLVVTTLALHYVAIYVLTVYQTNRVGVGGFILPLVEFGPLNTQQSSYYMVLVGAVIFMIVMRNLLRTRFGRAWTAIARDEIAAGVLGVRVNRQKVTVFGLSSVMIGIQGALFGYYLGVVTIDPFTFALAVSFVAMIVIGGIGSTFGTFIGALFVVGLPYAVTTVAGFLPANIAAELTSSLSNFEVLLYGAAIVLFLILEPRGLVFLWQRLTAAVASWPLGRSREQG